MCSEGPAHLCGVEVRLVHLWKPRPGSGWVHAFHLYPAPVRKSNCSQQRDTMTSPVWLPVPPTEWNYITSGFFCRKLLKNILAPALFSPTASATHTKWPPATFWCARNSQKQSNSLGQRIQLLGSCDETANMFTWKFPKQIVSVSQFSPRLSSSFLFLGTEGAKRWFWFFCMPQKSISTLSFEII